MKEDLCLHFFSFLLLLCLPLSVLAGLGFAQQLFPLNLPAFAYQLPTLPSRQLFTPYNVLLFSSPCDAAWCHARLGHTSVLQGWYRASGGAMLWQVGLREHRGPGVSAGLESLHRLGEAVLWASCRHPLAAFPVIFCARAASACCSPSLPSCLLLLKLAREGRRNVPQESGEGKMLRNCCCGSLLLISKRSVTVSCL